MTDWQEHTKLRDIELRVGALPKYPNGLMAYSFTWSPEGVINEYINDAEAIHNGQRKMVPSLDGMEYINIEGKEFEAFTTSGGLGTMCETFEGKVDTLNYKSIRYPGHGKLMKFMLQELIMKDDKEQLTRILENAKPPVKEQMLEYPSKTISAICLAAFFLSPLGMSFNFSLPKISSSSSPPPSNISGRISSSVGAVKTGSSISGSLDAPSSDTF